MSPSGDGPLLARALGDARSGALIVALTCALVFFLNLGATGLWDPDEARHAEIAREALVTGNWLTPTLHFEPYHDKPMFFYDCLALIMKLGGRDEWALRLPSALSACLSIAVTAWWGVRWIGALEGILGALVLATTAFYVALGRYVLIDMSLAGSIAAAFFYGSAWCMSPPERRRPIEPFYVFVALGVLLKGPVAVVLATLVFLPFARLADVPLRELRPGRGILILLVLAGSWYVAAAIVSPSYIGEFLWSHNVERFATDHVGHKQNALAYVYLLPAIFLPWSLYFPAGLAHARAHRRRAKSLPIQFCALWFAVTFVFFSVSSAKLATYLVPAFPPLALLVATAIAAAVRGDPLSLLEESAHRFVVWGLFGLLVSGMIGLAVVLYVLEPEHVGRSALLLALLPIVGLAGRFRSERRYDLVVPTVLGAAVACIVGVYGIITPVLDRSYSFRSALPVLATLPKDTQLVAWVATTHSLAFYRGRPLERLRSVEIAAERLSADEPTLLVTKKTEIEGLRRHLRAEAYLVFENERGKILVANRPPLRLESKLIVLSPLRANASETS